MSMNPGREATLGRESKDADTYSFQAEINQLLSLIINTFYTKKEVFLRELISNASDALDKAKYRTARENAESSPSVEAPAEAPAEYRIRLRADKEARTLVLEDTGVGMTRQELIDNLGTIAQSGTMQFMKQCSEGTTEESRQSLIGQFGVGFYSAYLVADRVSVTSRANGAPRAHTWESAANGTFTVSSGDAGAHTSAGTTITLYLKEDCAEYADEGHLRSLIHTYSSFIQYPIYMEVETTRDVPATDDDEKGDDEKDDDDEKDATDDARLPKTRVETCREWQLQNEQKPLWVRAQKDIKDSEYVSLYKALCNDWDEPLAWTHVVAEGNVDFRGILYVPKRAPVDLYDSNKRHSIKLFVKRVFVMDETDELIPEWLKFMRGVVDSEDMPLNISREMLQKNGVVKVMQRNIIKKSLELFDEMATERPDDYLTFYKNYSKCIKLGVHDESKHQAKLLKLLRYPTSKTFADASSSSASSSSASSSSASASPPMVSLDEYVERMPSAQKDIYFITGETDQIIDQSPFLERLKDEGTEVLYMSDPIDEYVMQGLREYDGRSFVSCTRLIKKRETKAESETEKESEKESEKEATDQEGGLELTEEAMTRLCKRFTDVLGHTVEAVLPSTRLVKSPACLVSSEFGWSANMERIMRAQTMRDNSRTEFMTAKKIMEINPTHRIIRDLSNRLGRVDESESETESGAKSESAESESALVDEVIHLLYESSVVDSGFTLDTPKRFVSRINHMISLGLSLDDDGGNANGDMLANRVDAPDVRIERVSSHEMQEKNTIRHDNVPLTNEGDSTEMQAVD